MVQFVIDEVNTRRQVRTLVTALLEKEVQSRVPTVLLLTQATPTTLFLPLTDSFGQMTAETFFSPKALFPCKRVSSAVLDLRSHFIVLVVQCLKLNSIYVFFHSVRWRIESQTIADRFCLCQEWVLIRTVKDVPPHFCMKTGFCFRKKWLGCHQGGDAVCQIEFQIESSCRVS